MLKSQIEVVGISGARDIAGNARASALHSFVFSPVRLFSHSAINLNRRGLIINYGAHFGSFEFQNGRLSQRWPW